MHPPWRLSDEPCPRSSATAKRDWEERCPERVEHPRERAGGERATRACQGKRCLPRDARRGDTPSRRLLSARRTERSKCTGKFELEELLDSVIEWSLLRSPCRSIYSHHSLSHQPVLPLHRQRWWFPQVVYKSIFTNLQLKGASTNFWLPKIVKLQEIYQAKQQCLPTLSHCPAHLPTRRSPRNSLRGGRRSDSWWDNVRTKVKLARRISHVQQPVARQSRARMEGTDSAQRCSHEASRSSPKADIRQMDDTRRT